MEKYVHEERVARRYDALFISFRLWKGEPRIAMYW